MAGLSASTADRLDREAATLALHERVGCHCPLPEPPSDGFRFPDLACEVEHPLASCPIRQLAVGELGYDDFARLGR